MAELTKVHSDKCITYKSPFGQMHNLQKSIRTNAEFTKIHSDKRQLEISDKRQLNNSDKCSFPEEKFYSRAGVNNFLTCVDTTISFSRNQNIIP